MNNESYKVIDSVFLNGIKGDGNRPLAELTDEELCEKAREKEKGQPTEAANSARNFLIARSKSLIESKVNYINTKFVHMVDFGDEIMYQAGRIGLNNAIDVYDLETAKAMVSEKGAKTATFRTFASYYIMKELYSEVDNYFGRVHIPDNINRSERKIKKLKEDNPGLSEKEIIRKAIKDEIVKDAKEYGHVILVCSLKNAHYLDEAYDDEGKTTLGDMSVPVGGSVRNPLDNIETDDMIACISRRIDKLPDEQSKVVRMIFGLNDEGRSYSIEEVRKELGMSSREVEQAKRKALTALRDESLRIFLE